MRVVFLEDVPGVAQGGDIKEVKNGFARNYLIPKSLATPATHNAVQRVTKLQGQAQVNRVRRLEDMKELAAEFDGFQVSVEMRAGSSGRLYGSVTNAIIAERLSELTEKEIDRRTVELEEPIRELGTYDLTVKLHPEVEAGISVLVYPTGTTPEEFAESLVAAEESADAEEEVVEAEAVETEPEEEDQG
ncbi:MAG: 50S ribosomal protein L9 [Dehalococcoidia bacterium]|nr:50S ribosomal protein L9 [Dehalococcoidia bacterium]